MSGAFTIKSAYRILISQRDGGPHINDEVVKTWRYLWRVKIPPKVINLLWRAASDCLPTRANLQSKNIQIDGSCPLCATELETTTHIFVVYPFATECWTLLGGVNFENEGTDLFDWLATVLRLQDTHNSRLICVLCWAIWRARNDIVWNGVWMDPARVISDVCRELAEWDEVQNQMAQGEGENESAHRWTRPSPGWVKINVDGACFDGYRRFGWACVARDHVGKCLGGRSISRRGVATTEVAEAMGICKALSWVKSNGWERVVIESDCLNVVNAVKNASLSVTYTGLILEDYLALLSDFDNVVISFVKRSANKVAYCLARESCFVAERTFNGEAIPPPCHVLLDEDLME